jgi:hypothetical protein
MAATSITEQIAANLFSAASAINGTGKYTNSLTVKRSLPLPQSPADKLVMLIQGTPLPLAAPWGIVAQKLRFTYVFYARAPEASTTAIDTYLNSIATDINLAVMADPRRGGLVDVDTVALPAQMFRGTSPGLFIGIVPLEIESRTLLGDPTTKAPASGNELFWQGGAELHYAQYFAGGALGPWRRWADLKIAPIVAVKTDEAKGDRDGLQRPVSEEAINWNQKYRLETQDFSPAALALFYGAGGVAAFNQSGSPLVAVPHLVAGVDSVLPLTDANENPLWNVQSIQTITDSAGEIIYNAGTDFIVNASLLQKGLIQIPPGSSIPPQSVVLISMTPAAINGQRVMNAQETGHTRYRARIVWTASGGLMQVHGPMDLSIVPCAGDRDGIGYSMNKFDLLVLDDGSDTPAGQIVLPTGVMPAVGN